ncbi:hypothetical protein JVT61DRAFT_6154 [Boletus reticuloceps]|uniref:Uncharacterized protein n=1 Tax=Boletus reticuloceps TaxID=495285 RepID=A0A8I3A6Q2_9AGAM|nr:hypothetical protein JVT61DRAFT_6154 [Boletus reticuloceps]
MGCPKLFNTPEEKREAVRANKCAYYTRNKIHISAKLKASHTGIKTLLTKRPDSQSSSISNHPSSSDRTDDRLQQHLGMLLQAFLERQYMDLVKTGNLMPIQAAISSLEQIVQELLDDLQQVLEDHRAGEDWKIASWQVQHANSVLNALQDLFCHASIDLWGLQEVYGRGEFLFQSL